MDYVSLGFVLVAALIGIRGETWSHGRPTKVGVVAIALAAGAFTVSCFLTHEGQTAKAQRNQLLQRLSGLQSKNASLLDQVSASQTTQQGLLNQIQELQQKIDQRSEQRPIVDSTAVSLTPGRPQILYRRYPAGTVIKVIGGTGSPVGVLYGDTTALPPDQLQAIQNMIANQRTGAINGVHLGIISDRREEAALIGSQGEMFEVALLGSRELQAKVRLEWIASHERPAPQLRR